MIFAIAERFPPCVCRVVAHKGWTPLSHDDIAKRSGLSKSYVSTLSKKTSWKGINIEIVEKFSKACGVDLLKPKRTVEYLRSAKMIHTKNCPANQKKFFAAIFKMKL